MSTFNNLKNNIADGVEEIKERVSDVFEDDKNPREEDVVIIEEHETVKAQIPPEDRTDRLRPGAAGVTL